MSKNNNVNPDHYKVAGRERPGKNVVKAPKQPSRAEMPMKGRAASERSESKSGGSKTPKRQTRG
jgi:hypothetical protein